MQRSHYDTKRGSQAYIGKLKVTLDERSPYALAPSPDHPHMAKRVAIESVPHQEYATRVYLAVGEGFAPVGRTSWEVKRLTRAKELEPRLAEGEIIMLAIPTPVKIIKEKKKVKPVIPGVRN